MRYQGRTSIEYFIDNLPLAKDKLLDIKFTGLAVEM
jgi:hypothetical protein